MMKTPVGCMETEPVTDGALLDKWRRVQTAITKDLEVVAQCQASQPCPAPAQKLLDLSLEGAGRSGRVRVGLRPTRPFRNFES
jgi:hypothetical protein